VSTAASLFIMIVDDDDDLRDAITDIMMAEGYQVAAFGDAREALVALERGRLPFLILLDLMMPRMSGWEFRAALLEDPRLASIPVAIVTAANSLSDGVRTVTDVDVLRKPFDLDALLTLVGRYAAVARTRHSHSPRP
jgi:CheY-like chemotaxis protein